MFLKVTLYIFLLQVFLFADAKREYLKAFPNYDKVPITTNNPDYGYDSLNYCEAFGHTNCAYTPSEQNDFGEQFNRADKTWTVNFCKSDTDGDKKTNGDELGDPCCEWNYGDASFPRLTAISNPAERTSTTSAPSCSLEGVPSAPTISSSHIGTSQLTLDFTSPSCVCAYKVVVNEGQTVINGIRPSQMPYTLCGLSGTVNVTVYALNLAGNSVGASFSTVLSGNDSRTCDKPLGLGTAGTVKPDYNSTETALGIVAFVVVGILILITSLIIKCCADPRSVLRGYGHHKRLWTPHQTAFVQYFVDWAYELSFMQTAFLTLLCAALVFWAYAYYTWYAGLYFVYGGQASIGRALGELSKPLGGILLLPMSKNSFWAYLSGASFERLIKFHRWAARLYIASLTTHAVLMIIGYNSSVFGAHYIFRWSHGNNLGNILAAFIGWILFLAIWLTSLQIVRRRQFKMFYSLHFLFAPAIVLMTLHTTDALGWMGPGLAVWALDLLASLVDVIIRPVTLVSAHTINDNESYTCLTLTKKFNWTAGQYVQIIIPSISILPHTFSISSAPGGDIVFYIKKMNDWTSTLYSAVEEGRITNNTKIYVYGASGTPSVQYEKYENVLLFAGGVGITPMASIYKNMLCKHENGNLQIQKRVHLVWSFRSLGLHKGVSALVQFPIKSDVFTVERFCTGSGQDPVEGVMNARANVRDIISNFVKECGGKQVAVLACGPESLMDKVLRECKKVRGVRLDVHVETFCL